MDKAGFLDRLGRENVCADVTAALARTRQLLGFPPSPETDPLQEERRKLEAARMHIVHLDHSARVLRLKVKDLSRVRPLFA